MKVVFVGPSLPDARTIAGTDIDVRQPACQGDVMRAVQDGATAIGLIDGLFELVAPVWHKELLFALSAGIPVFGGASMGALRAAECAAFGMIGIGRIFDDYMSGRRTDDADVALLHGPAELGYPAVTVPIVNVDAILERARILDLLTDEQCHALSAAARRIFFKKRSWKSVAELADIDWRAIAPIVKQARIDQKREDALSLLEALGSAAMGQVIPAPWHFNATPLWRMMYPTI